MSNPEKSDKLKKLKNKKKDIISISEPQNPIQNNFDDKSLKQIKLEKKSNELLSQPLSSELPKKPITTNNSQNNNNTLYIDYDKDSEFLSKKIILELQMLLSLSLMEPISLNILSKMLSNQHFNEVLEDKECRKFCCNFLCNKELVNKNRKIKYDFYKKEFTDRALTDLFCCVECYEKYKEVYNNSLKSFKLKEFISIDNMAVLYVLKDFFHKNEFLIKASQLAENLLDAHKRKYKEQTEQINTIIKKTKLEIGKKYIHDLEKIIQTHKKN